MNISIDTDDGNAKCNGTAHDSPQEPIEAQMPAYEIHEEPMGSKRKMKVIFMGMGSSGINFAHQAAKRLDDVEVVCYEKNSDLGGTWLENRSEQLTTLTRPITDASIGIQDVHATFPVYVTNTAGKGSRIGPNTILDPKRYMTTFAGWPRPTT